MDDIIRVTRPGATLAVHVRGPAAARPVVFVHGFPFDHAMWDHPLTGLEGWRRIAPDLRGAGASDAPASAAAYSMASYAGDLVAVCDALGVAAAVWCGFSMGGYVLFELWRRHPDRVRGLMLCDTRAEPDSDAGKRARDDQIALVARDGVGALADLLAPKLLGATTRSRAPQQMERVRDLMRRQPAAGVIGALGAMRERPDSTPVLPAIAVPTLVLHGTEDEIAPAAGARKMAARIPGARYVAIPGAGHQAPLEQPGRVTEALRAFLGTL